METIEEKIDPLTSFDFTSTDAIRYRPYESMTHVAMGIKKISKSEWIRVDRGYLDRIAERKDTMRKYPEDVFGTNGIVNPAIEELFREIIITLLPVRFPTMFKIKRGVFHNLATKESYQLEGINHMEMLRILGENVEEDFYIMCPDGHGEWRLQGYIACFPGGFLSPSRVGMSMRQIHQPVPGYEQRIGKGVDRFMQQLEPGTYVERMNWSLQVDGQDLFRTDGNNYYPEQGRTLPSQSQKVDIDISWLRVEHQTLNCLHHSRAIVFCVRTYMTSLADIRKEGSGPRLADAIESMPEKLGDYKKRPFWSRDVLAYLRS
ncbi:hypothetical protein TCE0_060f19271 [Talaromyces pinophilus]|uniref:DUF3445 domain-containing protein n=1 Tax=Talaromyces pinophilus TaxID=128442 RepID=A0A6V8HTT7_TALPI|nr:hypothetical protein TCE0_060f19271 [Talaromyces pinophilus]